MTADAAIRRLSFAEARASAAEAIVMMARHRTEVDQAKRDGVSEDVKAAEFADRARAVRAEAPHVDKTA
jgi:hypothetical protein